MRSGWPRGSPAAPTCSCPRTISPERLAVIRTYCGPPELAGHIEVELVGARPPRPAASTSTTCARSSRRGRRPCSSTTPRSSASSSRARRRSRRSRARAGAETIVGVDPISLGIVAPPVRVRRRHRRRLRRSRSACTCPAAAARAGSSRPATRSATRASTRRSSSASAGRSRASTASASRSSSRPRTGSREEGNDWTGNSVYLWAVANAVYMALLGPEGFAEVGRLIIARSHYAARRLAEIDGVRILFPRGLLQGVRRRLRRDRQDGRRGRTAALREHGIFGGKDLSRDFPELGQSALYCVTEVHARGRPRPARRTRWRRWSHDGATTLPSGTSRS